MNERSEITVTITDEQWQMCIEKMLDTNNGNLLSNDDIVQISQELADSEEFGRSANSAWFSINRLHMLVYGAPALDITERRALTLFDNCETAKSFVEAYGLTTEEIDYNMAQARAEMARRVAEQQRLVELRRNAARINFQYWKENKDQYNKRAQEALRAHRDDIVEAIGSGVPVEEAYAQYI
jgi:hypothetical protein